MKVRFTMNELLGIGMTIVILGIGLAYGIQIMGDVKDDVATCSTGFTYNTSGDICYNTTNTSQTTATVNIEFNASSDAMDGVAKLPEKLPTIATVIVAAVIIGVLVTYIWARFR